MLARHIPILPQPHTGDLRWTAIYGNATRIINLDGAGLRIPPRPSLTSRPSYVPAVRRYSGQAETNKKHRPSDIDPNPSFSFQGLGASPAAKTTIYVAVGVIATAESYAYGKWLWWKLRPKQLEDIDEDAENT